MDNLLNRKWKIRKLTPKECFRLQGVSDEMFERVPVIHEIAKKLETEE